MSKEIDNLETLTDAIAAAGAKCEGRFIVAIAGPPGAGKSTLVERLLASPATGPAPALLQMDGFHLDNAILDARGQRAVKGAPQTFDGAGFVATLERVRRDDGEVFVPAFDRAADLARAAALRIGPEHRVVLAEGNYLLLDQPPWDAVRELVDLTVLIDVPVAELERRLVRRWLDHGLSPQAARRRAEENDLINARLVVTRSIASDIRFVTGAGP